MFSQRRRNIEEPIEQGNERYARELFKMQNFREALDEFLPLIRQDSLNPQYNYCLGVCYLNTNLDKLKAIPFLEFASKDNALEPDVWYELGRAYQYAYRFEEAIDAFRKYMMLQGTRRDKFYIPPSRQIEMCRNAMEIMLTPVDVAFFNLGPQINSAFPDFNPFVPADESFVIYTSKRDVNTGRLIDFDGYYTSDVYMTVRKDSLWGKAKNIGGVINSELIEETVGISSDGNTVFLYIDNFDGFNDIIWLQRKGRSFPKGTFINPDINSNSLETSGAISPDRETIIFASERNEGYGGTDLYMSKKSPSGEWMPSEIIGTTINTEYNEDFPIFSHDGKSLYFTSQGHKSMGGFDIFRTDWDKENNTWSEPVNIGYPLNTPEDNMTICMSQTGRFAYLAARRPEGFGDLDLYKVVFNDVAPPFTIIKGSLLDKDSANIYTAFMPVSGQNQMSPNRESNMFMSGDELSVSINVYKTETGDIFGRYKPNKMTGSYIIVLPPGNYNLVVNSNKFNTYSENITVSQLNSHNTHIVKNILLQPLE